MDYTGIQSKRITKTIDLQLVGIYTDKKTSHIDKMLSKPAFNLVKKCFKNNSFTGELGDTRTFDDQEHDLQIVFFGLGKKDKFGPLMLNRAIKAIIKHVAAVKSAGIIRVPNHPT